MKQIPITTDDHCYTIKIKLYQGQLTLTIG